MKKGRGNTNGINRVNLVKFIRIDRKGREETGGRLRQEV